MEMGLRFILGRSGTGKSDMCLREMKEQALRDPQGPPIFYITPDQMTFQQEYALFRDEQMKGSIRVQIVSFSRLSWRILQETGGATRKFISSVGMQMMLRKIIEEKQDEWHGFKKAIEKQGFLEQLEQMIAEFKRYGITPEMLNEQIERITQQTENETNEQALADKLTDLTYIYEKLIVSLHGKYIDSEDQLQQLADKISQSTLLNDAEIYLDGFHRLTPQELLVVEELLKKCKRVSVTLTMDEYKNNQHISELDLFYQTKDTYRNVSEIARKNNIPINESVHVHPENNEFISHPVFRHLEENFDVRPALAFTGGENVPITIKEAVHPRAEVEGIAQEVLRLVREEGYRFSDMAVFVREADVYHDLMDTIFADYEIPVFIDEKRPMIHHALIEFIRSALDVVEENWRYDAVFRVLKTGFIPMTDDQYPLNDDGIDELENYVLEYGIRSRERWFGKENWSYRRFKGFDTKVQTTKEKEIETRMNAYRKQVLHALKMFDETIRKAETVKELCEQIFILMEKVGVAARLQSIQTYYDETGMIEKGREQEQVWNAVVDSLDEMVEIAGEENISLPVFKKAIEAGFETLKFAHVPPSMDHVIVGTIDRSRFSDIKCAFQVGVNEGVWPMKPPLDGMINEKEREILEVRGLELADSSKRKLLDDWFYMYIAFSAASDKLWISYLLSDEEGKAKMPSQLINRIHDLFPSTKNHQLLEDPEELIDAERFISTPLKTRSALTAQLARYQKGYPVKDIWWHVLNWYIENESKHSTTYQTLQSLYYQNQPVNLSRQTVDRLYPKQVKTSVSRLEMYHRCSYQHFAEYSLKLKERKTYKLDAPDIGNLFHEALKKITEWIQHAGKSFSEVYKKEAEGYARRAVEKLAPVLQHEILMSSNRYRYIQQKLQEVISRATYILSEQARRTSFSPVGLELGFGQKEQLPPITLPLENGFELMLRGRIDRVDKAVNGEELFLRIIDYKSSARNLNLVDVYYGLALQMLTYLDVVLTHSETWLGTKATPAGVLYFHVHNPMISSQHMLSDEKLEDELLKTYKMQGLLLSDEQIIQLMDTSLEAGSSKVVPAGLKKKGGFYNYSKVANESTFSNLQQYIHTLMIDAGIDITNGGIHLNPFQKKEQIACTFCPFKSVCQFDPTLPDNHYHQLMDMKDQDVLEHIHGKEES